MLHRSCCINACVPGGQDQNMNKDEVGYIVHTREGYDEDANYVNDDGPPSSLSNKAHLEMMRQQLVRDEKIN